MAMPKDDDNPFINPGPMGPLTGGKAVSVPPFRRDFDMASDPYTARNALGITFDPSTVTGRFNKVNVQVFTSNGTFTPSTGMKYCIIEAVGGGGGGQTMRNDKGVVINVASTTQGLQLTLAPKGVEIQLK